VYPADSQGCGTVRLIWASNHLKRLGHDVTILPPSSTTGINGRIYQNPNDPNDPLNDSVVSVDAPADADVIVLQRVLLKYLAVDAIPLLRRKGVAVVVDMDDDLTRIDPSNAAFNAMHPRNARDPKRHWGHATTACMNATMVTVSTPALVTTYAPHGRGRVIPNCVPEAFTQIPHMDSDVIGWGGSLHSHPKDMLPLGPSIARLVREGEEFAVVGPGLGMKEALGLDRAPFATGPVNIQDWPFALSDNLGIGIAPLADTEFNRAKSWLKPLEMMSVGIPWVASPRAEYLALHKSSGVGLMAEKPKEWYRQVKRLVTDDRLRQDMSAAGRVAAQDHTVEGSSWRLWEAWSDALKAERVGRSGSPLLRV
jgi:glycosyltransferase involved in cell wall biosynthesis